GSPEVPSPCTQRDSREILGSRRTHEQRLRSQLSLGTQYIGPTTYELVRRPDVQRIGQSRQRPRVEQRNGQRTRYAAEQYRQPIAVECDLRFEPGRGREGQVENRLGALGIERSSSTGGEPVFGELHDLSLVRCIPLRYGNLPASSPQIEVS